MLAMRSALDRRGKAYRDASGEGPASLAVSFDRLPEGAVPQAPQPIFQWVLPVDAGRQRGYQLLVSGSREMLDRNQGDCWDTRQVRSAQTEQVGYLGKPLQKGRTYFWKVRVWDSANRTRDYSEAASFRAD